VAVGDAELQDLYRDVLVDYYRDPIYKGTTEPSDIHSHGVNPVCGDEIEVTLARDGNKIREIKFKGHGCVISQASSAMMCEAVEGKTFSEARELVEAFKGMMLKNAPIASLPEALGEVEALEGVRKFPLRVKCALLGWNTFLQGIDDDEHGKKDAEYEETPMCAAANTAGIGSKIIGEALAPVQDPEIHVSIVELGLIYGAEVTPAGEGDGSKVKVTMSLTSPACPYGPMLLASVHGALAKIPGVRDVDVDLSFDPVWDPKTMASEEAKDQLGIF
jgi:nitrogen fixation NifU-like protein